MEKVEPPFNKYLANSYSQNGEDGVIAEILRRLELPKEDRWCCEFGAWNGVHLSNTFHLIEQGWHGVYIEGDIAKFHDLSATAKKFERIIPVNAYVERFRWDKNSLDNILKRSQIPTDFDVLSIDIDSNDLDVFESMTVYSPKLVIIEINSSIPPGIFLRHSQCGSGNSFSSTLKVGMSKGYSLVCHTGNLIFVRNDQMRKLEFPSYFNENPEMLFNGRWLKKGVFDLE